MMSAMNHPLAWPAIIASLIICALALSIRQRLRLRRARTWPVSKGTVISTAVRLEGSGTDQRYTAELNYSYENASTLYFGHMRRNFMLHGRAHARVKRYSTGCSVLVHYNPRNPRDAVLFEEEQIQAAGAA